MTTIESLIPIHCFDIQDNFIHLTLTTEDNVSFMEFYIPELTLTEAPDGYFTLIHETISLVFKPIDSNTRLNLLALLKK